MTRNSRRSNNGNNVVVEDNEFAQKPRNSNRRKVKQENGVAPTPKLEQVKRVSAKLESFVPTTSQKTFINKIIGNTVTFCDSPAGTGKTSATLYHFCKEYLRDPSLHIYITRTPAEVGKDRIGFLPNSAEEKCAPHFASTKHILEVFLGKEKVEADLGKRIHFTIPNYILGATLDNSLWLLDEAQLFQPIIMKLLLERIGKNTKVVVSGSSTQIYTADKDRGGMQDAIDRFFDEEYNPLYRNFAYHHFSVDEVMRSEVVKAVLRAYGDV